MGKFLDAYELPKLNQENINYLNRSVTRNEIDVVIEFSNRENPRTGWIPSIPLKKK
jgi:hypothetical protein